MRPLRSLALALALAGTSGSDDLAIPMADGQVLRGERVDDPEIFERGVRIRTGGIVVFVPWEEMDPKAAALIREGQTPQVMPVVPPAAPMPPEEEDGPAEETEVPIYAEPVPEWVPGEPPPMPACFDPRY